MAHRFHIVRLTGYGGMGFLKGTADGRRGGTADRRGRAGPTIRAIIQDPHRYLSTQPDASAPFAAALYSHHDRSLFDVVRYPAVESQASSQLAAAIRHAEIDILVDLAAHASTSFTFICEAAIRRSHFRRSTRARLKTRCGRIRCADGLVAKRQPGWRLPNRRAASPRSLPPPHSQRLLRSRLS